MRKTDNISALSILEDSASEKSFRALLEMVNEMDLEVLGIAVNL